MSKNQTDRKVRKFNSKTNSFEHQANFNFSIESKKERAARVK